MLMFKRVTMCRISFVLLVVLLWIGLWYSSTLPGPSPGESRSPFQKNFQVRNSSDSNNGSVATFWEVEDRRLTDDLLGEVVEELEKIRRGISLDPEQKSNPCNVENASNAATQDNFLKSPQLVGPSLHSLVISSVSRLSLEEFTAVGVASVDLRRLQRENDSLIHSCAWVPKVASASLASSLAAANDSSVVWSPVLIRFVNDSQAAAYDVAVITCSFDQPVGANGEGGFLVFNSTSSSLKQDYVSVFREKPDEITSIPFEGPFRFEYAHCSPLISESEKFSKRFVREWFLYHQGLWSGKIHYMIYDGGGVDESLREVFQPMMKQGVMTIVDFREFGKYRGHEQQHAINDCLQRTRFMARWTFLWSFDEYFQMVDKSPSLSFLETNEKSPWISLGSMIWSRTYCGDNEDDELDQWAVQRMCFRLKHPTCGDEHRANTCHGIEGQRKWIADPRKVLMGTIHRTLEPEWNGVILEATVARLNRFDELSAEGTEEKNCWIVKKLSQIDQNSAVDGWWYRDASLSEAALKIKTAR